MLYAMVPLFSQSIYRFPGCLYCISKNLRTARRLLGEYIPIGDEPKRKLSAHLSGKPTIRPEWSDPLRTDERVTLRQCPLLSNIKRGCKLVRLHYF